MVALTFDDGPDPDYTPHVLSTLDHFGARATFFVIGANVRAHPRVFASAIAGGHGIGNHTEDHADLRRLTEPDIAEQIADAERSIAGTGAELPTLFRPPRGYIDESVRRSTDPNRYRTVFWDSCLEASVNRHGVRVGVERLLGRIRPGSIILAHDGGRVAAPGHPVRPRDQTMLALPVLLQGLESLGLQVVDIDTLLANRLLTV